MLSVLPAPIDLIGVAVAAVAAHATRTRQPILADAAAAAAVFAVGRLVDAPAAAAVHPKGAAVAAGAAHVVVVAANVEAQPRPIRIATRGVLEGRVPVLAVIVGRRASAAQVEEQQVASVQARSRVLQ